MSRVLAFGTFDLLHEGHHAYLRQAKAFGDELWVLVANDQAVRWAKGYSALQDQDERLAQVAELPFVDKAFIGGPVARKEDYLRPIEKVRPAIICLGYDQALQITDWLKEAVAQFDFHPRVVRAEAYKPHIFKTKLLRQMRGQ